ncbi:MAG TPA: EamA family transporter [Chloroflexi bacterium]|nr:EamA family transporter [Chloroflexota bacterium]HHW85732.1 DMT family transporter [Chloroflexota bacterium]
MVWGWYVVALAAHTGWGVYPVLGRYLQTVSGLPSMSVLVIGGLPLTVWLCVAILPRHGWRIYASPVLWVFGVVTVLRSVTNILSQRYTLAIYIQLIGLLTPFLVVLLSRIMFKARPPRFTWPALSLITLGALLMMSDIGATGMTITLTATDWIGIGLALASSLFLALYMILVRRTAHTAASGVAVLAFQTVLIQISALSLSLFWGEDWGRWRTIGAQDWAVFIAYSLLVVVLANGLQIAAIRRLGAPMVSSLMGWRLVATLSMGVLLLGEHLTSLWQGMGMLLVLGTITWYLSRQR